MPMRFSTLLLALLIATPIAPSRASATVTSLALLDAAAQADPVELFGLSDRAGASFSPTKPVYEAPFPYLPDEPEGRSFSIGTVTDGYVVNAVPLPQPGLTYGVLPRQLHRGLAWGTQEIIAAIVDASERVAREYPGSVLWLGNIGARGGGDISYSVSHNAGRDADLAFYSVDPRGNPVAPPDLLHFDRFGRSREYGGYYRFDVPRNWALVRALIESPHSRLQYLFLSNPLRSMLLDYAVQRGEDPTLIAEARRVLYQPGPEIPHDDHLHVRFHCGRADFAAGCTASGPPPRDGIDVAALINARIALAVSLLRHGEPLTRARAVERLALLQARSEIDAVHRRLSDPSAWVRARAVAAIARLGSSAHMTWLTQHWEEEDDALVLEQILLAAGELRGTAAGELLARQLRAEPTSGRVHGKTYDLRFVAVRSATRIASGAVVPALIQLLTDPDRELAISAHAALCEIANLHVDGLDLRDGNTAPEAVSAAWNRWWAGARDASRDGWLDEGFAAAGYSLAGGSAVVAGELARAAGDPRRWVRRNAQLELMRITGNPARSLDWSARDATTYWTRWVRRNPNRVGRR